MKTFRNYILDEFNIEMPQGEISGAWFSQNGLPMILACTCCGMTMSAPSALIDHNGQVYCSGCGDPTEWEPLPEDTEDLGRHIYSFAVVAVVSSPQRGTIEENSRKENKNE